MVFMHPIIQYHRPPRVQQICTLARAYETILHKTVRAANLLPGHILVDDVLRGDVQSIKEFVESPACKVLQEKQVLRKPTLMRLSKADDAVRRTKLAAYALAKAAKDPDYKKLTMYIKGKKAMTAKIMKKYGNKASRIAVAGQKNYIKVAQAAGSSSSDEKK